jgi:exodeoxyribonuclease V beta subunit
VHRVFERADFTQPAQWPAVVEAALDGLPGTEPTNRPARAAMLLRMLREVCAAPLLPAAAGQAPMRLGELPMGRRLNELEFHLSAPSLSAAALNAELTALNYPVPPLAFGQLQGWLRGFIDLVFEHDGRWWVLDWKSNHLGPSPAHYTPAACARAMADQGYHLQALVYALALQRLLALRLPGYRHEAHYGGVAYVFVRGFRPGWTDAEGRPCGLHIDRPSAEVLQRLDALFQGAGR